MGAVDEPKSMGGVSRIFLSNGIDPMSTLSVSAWSSSGSLTVLSILSRTSAPAMPTRSPRTNPRATLRTFLGETGVVDASAVSATVTAALAVPPSTGFSSSPTRVGNSSPMALAMSRA
ncbi:hypothetical protein RhoFasSB10_02897 [Rhodococcus fascians]|nr:hypothetical protein [Rhodococcus fascians]